MAILTPNDKFQEYFPGIPSESAANNVVASSSK